MIYCFAGSSAAVAVHAARSSDPSGGGGGGARQEDNAAAFVKPGAKGPVKRYTTLFAALLFFLGCFM